MDRIAFFLLVIWLLTSCVPGAKVGRVASDRAVVQQNTALDGLRPVVRAMLSGEIDSRLPLVQFLKTPCTNQEGLGGPPKCQVGKSEGSEVEVFPLGGAEGTFVTREEIGTVLEIPVQSLYAIYRIPIKSGAEPYWPEGEYALIFTRETKDYPKVITVRVTDGKIVRIDHAMGHEPSSLLEGIGVENILLPPEAVAEWVKENSPSNEKTVPKYILVN